MGVFPSRVRSWGRIAALAEFCSFSAADLSEMGVADDVCKKGASRSVLTCRADVLSSGQHLEAEIALLYFARAFDLRVALSLIRSVEASMLSSCGDAHLCFQLLAINHNRDFHGTCLSPAARFLHVPFSLSLLVRNCSVINM